MNINYGARGILMIDNAKIIFRNFAGAGTKFNREGDRNFAVIIDNIEAANRLQADGWNVKIKPPREEGDAPFMYLPVKIKFNERGPHVHVETAGTISDLTEGEMACLDQLDIGSADMDLRPYDWEVQGKIGRTAYLQSIMIHQNISDRFARRAMEE